MKQELLDKIGGKRAVAAVIGLGYVGLSLSRHLCEAGIQVIGLDEDADKIAALREGRNYIRHVCADGILELIASKRFDPTSDFARLEEADCILIAVPTPLTPGREPDLSHVEQACVHVAEFLRPGQLVVLESTTYPGTTTELVLPMLAKSGLKIGEEYFLAFSPEREDPGNAKYTIANIPKVVGGVTRDCEEVAVAFYRCLTPSVITVSDPATAEMAKLLENVFRSVNIALVNELKMLCDRMELDVWEVIRAASTKPFGFMPFYPGPGLGGHCIAIDPFYLSWKAREYGIATRFIELSGEVNAAMPGYVVTRTKQALHVRGISLESARVLILGVAYKADVDDVRESPSLRLIELLEEAGAAVDYHDPHVPALAPCEQHNLTMVSASLDEEMLSDYDCVIIATAHSCFDAERILKSAPLVVDTRNFLGGLDDTDGKIVRA